MDTEDAKRIFSDKLLVIFLVFSPVLTAILTNQGLDPLTQTSVGIILIAAITVISIVAIITDFNEKKNLADNNVKIKENENKLKLNENDNNAKIAIAQTTSQSYIQNQAAAALNSFLNNLMANPETLENLAKLAIKNKANKPAKSAE